MLRCRLTIVRCTAIYVRFTVRWSIFYTTHMPTRCYLPFARCRVTPTVLTCCAAFFTDYYLTFVWSLVYEFVDRVPTFYVDYAFTTDRYRSLRDLRVLLHGFCPFHSPTHVLHVRWSRLLHAFVDSVVDSSAFTYRLRSAAIRRCRCFHVFRTFSPSFTDCFTFVGPTHTFTFVCLRYTVHTHAVYHTPRLRLYRLISPTCVRWIHVLPFDFSV